MSKPPRIAIIGAGPAGLTLARLLHVADAAVEVTVFEKDTSPTARHFVGGTLDLHEDTGLAAVRKAGLWEQFRRFARYDGQALVLADKYATKVFNEGAGEPPADDDDEDSLKKARRFGGARPEIDRERLKEILLDSVPTGCVRWGWKLTAISPSRVLDFDGKESEGPFELVVGADGAWSRVRHMLTDARPAYSGIVGFEMKIPHPNEEFPAISKMIGRGNYFACSDCKSLTGQRMGDESIKIGCFLRDEKTYPQTLMEQYDTEGVQRKILDRFDDWAPCLRDWIRCSDPESIQSWSLYELPVGHEWEHKKGFTLLGDAAHLMTPFAGEGVNAAMKDALELSEAITQSLRNNGEMDAAVERYEDDMFPRAATVQAETMTNKTYMFQEDAPLGLMMKMLQVVAETEPSTMTKILSLLPVRVAIYCCLWLWLGAGRLRYRWWS